MSVGENIVGSDDLMLITEANGFIDLSDGVLRQFMNSSTRS